MECYVSYRTRKQEIRFSTVENNQAMLELNSNFKEQNIGFSLKKMKTKIE